MLPYGFAMYEPTKNKPTNRANIAQSKTFRMVNSCDGIQHKVSAASHCSRLTPAYTPCDPAEILITNSGYSQQRQADHLIRWPMHPADISSTKTTKQRSHRRQQNCAAHTPLLTACAECRVLRHWPACQLLSALRMLPCPLQTAAHIVCKPTATHCNQSKSQAAAIVVHATIITCCSSTSNRSLTRTNVTFASKLMDSTTTPIYLIRQVT